MTQVGRFAHADRELWGVLDGEAVRPLAGPFEEWATVLADGGEPAYHGDPLPASELRTMAPHTAASRIFCFGGTYQSHMERLQHVLESAATPPPKAPGAFLKPTSALVDPDAEIAYPPTTNELDFEIEVVVVVARALAGRRAGDAILGYTIGNDVSARDAKNRSGGSDFFSMKALDRTSPLGPWITIKDECGEHPDLELTLRVNGEVRQQDRTASLMWTFGDLLEYIDRRVALRPGDLVFTGTPSGVAWEDGRFLQPGDVVEASVTGIGTLRNTVGSRQAQR